jgi:hypothetical protein
MVWLKLEALEAWRATVIWANEETIGCEFDQPLHPAVLATLLRPAAEQQRLRFDIT